VLQQLLRHALSPHQAGQHQGGPPCVIVRVLEINGYDITE
jgi:hypothetical protein